EKAEERCELDDRIHGNGGSVFKRIADGIADDRGVVEWRAFLLQLDFDDFLSVVPRAAGVGHKDRLVQTENGDGNEIADEEKWFKESKGQRREEHGDEDVDHAFLRVERADFDDFLAVTD